MRPREYIGVTGFKTKEEVREIKEFHKGAWHYIPMYGVISSNKRFADPSSEGSTSPSLKNLEGIFREMPAHALSAVHYFTPNRENLASEVIQVLNPLYGICNGLQINMDWPELNQVEMIKQKFPELGIILQLPKEGMKGDVIQKAQAYQGLVSYVLVDPSAGEGKDFSSEHITLMGDLYEALPTIGIGIAGGLSADNIEKRYESVASVLEKPFSIDAQGKLRTKDKTFLDLEKVKKYVDGASKEIRLADKFYFADRY